MAKDIGRRAALLAREAVLAEQASAIFTERLSIAEELALLEAAECGLLLSEPADEAFPLDEYHLAAATGALDVDDRFCPCCGRPERLRGPCDGCSDG
jgi:hypothetical protein